MKPEIINTDSAPAAIGTYSQAIKVNDTVYLSGQIAMDPASGELVPGDIEAQLHRVFQNLRAVCNAAGGDLQDIVKLNIYLIDLGVFAAVNKIMGEYFSAPFPARAAVEISALPKGAAVEMDAVMVLHL